MSKVHPIIQQGVLIPDIVQFDATILAIIQQ